LGIKTQISPFFSVISSAIGLKIFLVGLQQLWVGCFFVYRYILSIKIGMFRKIFGILKNQGFPEVFTILVLLPKVLGIFRKKTPSPMGFYCPQ
jgi:hypothetical protein